MLHGTLAIMTNIIIFCIAQFFVNRVWLPFTLQIFFLKNRVWLHHIPFYLLQVLRFWQNGMRLGS